MTLGKHSLDNRAPCSSSVNRTLSVVVTGDEEGCLEAVGCKFVKKIAGVKIRTIVISQGDITRVIAVVDILTIGNTSKNWASNAGSRSTGRSKTGVTSTVSNKTIWGPAVVLGGTAVTCRTAALAVATDSTVVHRTTEGIITSVFTAITNSVG